MDTGTTASAIGHGAVILWLLVGGFFARPPDAPAVAVTEVSLLSSAEFEAIAAAARPPGAEEPEPAPEGAPVVSSVVPPPRPAELDAPAAPPEPPQGPEPVAEPAPAPEPLPEPPPAVPAAEDRPQLEPTPLPEAAPSPATRVAPTPAEAPDPEAAVAEVETPAVTPELAAQAVEDSEAAAPEEATTEIVTEQTETAEAPAPAPASVPRPRTRPEAPAPVAVVTASAASEPEPEPADAAQVTASDDALADAIAGAVSEAVSSSSAGSGTAAPAPVGPPLTAGEKDTLRIAVQRCWNVGSLSSDALLVTVTVAVSVAQSGIPDAASIRMLGFEGGSEAGARQAFEAARRAIIRCGATGFPLPPEKYDQWRSIEMVFNPERMRIK